MTEKQNRILNLVMVGILMFAMFVVANQGAAYVDATFGKRAETVGGKEAGNEQTEGEKTGQAAAGGEAKGEEGRQKDQFCVVIDAGHGGSDPGKVGINDALEKEINLQLAFRLKTFLEAADVHVVMTRTDENGLYEEDASNKKVQDMKRRLALIEEADPELVISIHQNSYHQEYVKGAQVFYYTTSTAGKELAELLQEQLRAVDPENSRQAKGNDSYYLLKKTAKPIVIVECGFLSNSEEAAKLVTPLYQEKLAWQIHMGVMKYLNASSL